MTDPAPRALVTGATRNIGLGIAFHLAGLGFEVLVNGRTRESVDQAVTALRDAGLAALPCVADITQAADAFERAVEAVASPSAPITTVVNNAVTRVFGDALAVDPKEWTRCLDIVLTGTLNTARCALPGMRARRYGRIINLAGVSAQSGSANRVAVAAAKGGLIGLTKAMARDEAARGITVNAVSPGDIDTDRGPNPSSYGYDQADIPAGRKGAIREVASVVGYLAGPDAGFITGQVIGVNGGRYM